MGSIEHAVDLRVPPEEAFSSLVFAVVDDAAARAELDGERRSQIAAGAKTGFELIVRQAMAHEREPVHVRAAWTPAEVRVSLIERGLPLDERGAGRDPHWSAILSAVDAARWILHGRAGSELRLSVNRPHGMGESVEPPPASDTETAPPQNYSIRRFRAEDAPGVARAFFRTWGYRYVFPAVYVPKRLIELNNADAYISIVAVAEDGEVVGHYALDPFPQTPMVDGCAAIVVPEHRGRGLLERLRHAAEDEAARLGFAAFYSEPVTTHERTQTDAVKFGAKLCAIVLGADPVQFVPQQMSYTGAGQRQSFTIYIKPLKARETRIVYPPARHRDMIERIYANLGLPVEMRAGSPADERGELHIAITRGEGFATIDATAPGTATPEQLAQAVGDLRGFGRLGAVYLNLPLEHPATPSLCEAAEKLGFFFCGVVPWIMAGHDALRLQLPFTRLDLSQVTIAGDFGRELKAYISRFAEPS